MTTNQVVYLKAFGKTYQLTREQAEKSKFLKAALSERWNKDVVDIILSKDYERAFEYVYSELAERPLKIKIEDLYAISSIVNYLDIDFLKDEINKLIIFDDFLLDVDDLMALYNNLNEFPWLRQSVEAQIISKTKKHNDLPKDLEEKLNKIGTAGFFTRKLDTSEGDSDKSIYIKFEPAKYSFETVGMRLMRTNSSSPHYVRLKVTDKNGTKIEPYITITREGGEWYKMGYNKKKILIDEYNTMNVFHGDKIIILPKSLSENRDFIYTNKYVAISTDIIYVYSGDLTDNIE